MANAVKTGGVSGADRQRLEEVDLLLSQGPRAVPELVERLADASWMVRRAVIAALAALGDVAVSPVVRVVEEGRDDENRIAAAVDTLVVSTSSQVTPAMEALANHQDAAVVADAAQVLGRRRDPAATPVLRRLVEHENDNVAVVAIESLGRIGGRTAVDALVAATKSGSFFRLFPAIDVLGRTEDPRAVAPLAALLDEPVYAMEAARALARTGQATAVGPLVGLLDRPLDSLLRLAAVALVELVERSRERTGSSARVEETLRELAGRPAVVRRLQRSLQDSDATERRSIARLLGYIGADEAVPTLVGLLDGAAEVASVAAEALASFGQHSTDALAVQLRSGDSARRRVVLPALKRASAVPEILACLSDPDARVRAMACESLARLGDKSVLDELVPLLDDENTRVAHAAAGAIQSLGSDEVIGRIRRVAANGSVRARAHALRILGYLGAIEAEDLFVAAMRSPDDAVRDAAFAGAPLLGSRPVLDVLFDQAANGGAATRASAMRALGRCSVDPRATAYLLAGLDDEDSWVRYHATLGLGRLRCEAAAAPMRRLLQGDDELVRVAAVEALSYLDSALAHEALKEASKSDNKDLVRAAITGLGLAGKPDALPVVMAASRSSDVATRTVALSALMGFDGDAVVDTLKAAVRDGDDAVRTAAVGLLGARREASATSALVDLARERPDDQALRAALSVPMSARIDELLARLDHVDDDLAPILTSALARMDRRDATAALFDALESKNAAARKAAAETLAGIGTKDALEAVRKLVQTDDDAEVRRVAALLLG